MSQTSAGVKAFLPAGYSWTSPYGTPSEGSIVPPAIATKSRTTTGVTTPIAGANVPTTGLGLPVGDDIIVTGNVDASSGFYSIDRHYTFPNTVDANGDAVAPKSPLCDETTLDYTSPKIPVSSAGTIENAASFHSTQNGVGTWVVARGGESIQLDHYLEVLRHKPGGDRVFRHPDGDQSGPVDPRMQHQSRIEAFRRQRPKERAFCGEVVLDLGSALPDPALLVTDIPSADHRVQLRERFDLGHWGKPSAAEPADLALDAALLVRAVDAGLAVERVESVVGTEQHPAVILEATTTISTDASCVPAGSHHGSPVAASRTASSIDSSDSEPATRSVTTSGLSE